MTANGGLGKLRRKRAGVDIRVVEPARRSAVRLSRADVLPSALARAKGLAKLPRR